MQNLNVEIRKPSRSEKNKKLMREIKKYKYYYLMALPALVLLILFHYVPLYGLQIAFYEYGIFGITDFIGLENFRVLFHSAKFFSALRNTIEMALVNLTLGITCAVGYSLLLNEISNIHFKKITQTVLYLPHFLSWVVVASIFSMILSPNNGLVNQIIQYFGGEPIYFLVSEKFWRPIYYFITRWKETGWGTIIYLAAITAVDAQLYEAAAIDGAGKLKQTWHVTLPAIRNTILIVLVMDLSKILNVFDPVFVLMNPNVYSVADVIGTYTYRVGLIEQNYGYSTAVGLFKSVIAMILILMANKLCAKIKGSGIL